MSAYDALVIGRDLTSGVAKEVLFVGSNQDLQQDSNFTWDKTNQTLSIVSTASPVGIGVGLLVSRAFAISGALLPFAIEGLVTNLGANAVTTGHMVGVFGLAADIATSQANQYGVEGRTSSLGVGAEYAGVLGLGTWQGAGAFSGILAGMKIRAEITTDGSTPKSSGTLRMLWIAAPIGSGSAGNSYAIYCQSTDPSFFAGKFGTYNNDTLAGNGLSSVVASVGLTGQSAAIGAAGLFTPVATGLYRINIYMVTTTTGNTVTVSTTIAYTDDNKAQTQTTGTIAIQTAGAFIQQSYIIEGAASGLIFYQTNISGALGAGRYSVYVTVERIS